MRKVNEVWTQTYRKCFVLRFSILSSIAIFDFYIVPSFPRKTSNLDYYQGMNKLMPSSKIWTLCSYGCSCIWLLNAHVLHTQKRNMGLISEHLWWSNLLVKLQLCSLELNNKRTSTTNVLLDFFLYFQSVSSVQQKQLLSRCSTN